ncbi:MAG: hypothetical protein HGA98_00200 [Deltaproteobacteria bacterium]|nr:hypothetical protein [Deltaproteobacteria bacterium]
MTRLTLFALFSLLAAGAPARADDPRDLTVQLLAQRAAAQSLAAENAQLREKLAAAEASSLSRDDLLRVNLAKVQGVARDIKAQRQTMADFEGYIRWMSGSLSAYSRYVEAGSAAAAFARYLPIPYAGQAAGFAKFVAHFALALNAASNSVEKYLKTSQQFVGAVEAVHPTQPPGARWLADIGRYADEQVLRDMGDVQGKLTTTSQLSGSILAFLEGMNQYLSSGDEYWNKTKQVVTRKDVDPKEKSFLTENVATLKTQAAWFDGRLRLFDESANRVAPSIKALLAYEELVKEIDARVAARKP